MSRQYSKDIQLRGGLQQATSELAGDGFITLRNVSRYRADGIRRRPGLATRIETAGIVMSGLRINGEQRLIQLLDTGAIVSHGTSYEAVVSTIVASSLVTSSTYGVFAKGSNMLIFANGTDSVRYINSIASTGSIGLAAPSGDMPDVYSTNTTVTNGVTAGTHIFRYRYINNADGYWSDPSGIVTVTTEGGRLKFQVSSTTSAVTYPTDARVDRLRIEGTKANGTTFYPVYDNPISAFSVGGTITVITSDQSMDVNAYRYNYPYATDEDVGNASPPVLDYVAEHRGRIFGLAGRYLYWSQYGRPHSWSSASQARSVFQSADDQATGLLSVDSDLYCFGRFSVWRLAYTEFPDEGVLTQMPTKVGLWHQRLLCSAEGRTFGWGPSGIWVLSVMTLKIISEPVRPTLVDDIDYSEVEQFHCVVDPEDRVILFFYVPDGESTCTGCLVYDYVNNEWRTNTYDRAIQASYMLTKQDGQARAFLADNINTWHLENGLKDGVLAGNNSKFTAAASTSSTTISVNESVQTSETLEGTYLYRVSDGLTRRIVSNTANGITFGGAYPTAIAAGEEFWVGSIDMRIVPKWFTAPDPFDKIRIKQVAINQIPDSSSTGDWRVHHYGDFSSVATSKTISATDEPPNGQSVTDGDTYSEAEIDQQFVGCRYFPSNWYRAVKIKLTQRDPDCDPTLTRMTFRFETAEGGAE